MEILLISVAFGAFSSLVTVFISKKINKAKFEVFIEQAKAKARVIEHEAEVALKDAQLKAKFECDREFKNARKEYENMLFKIEKKEKELNEHLENELRLIKAQKEGEDVVMELGIKSMHIELIKLVGRLRYRASYGQNALAHTLEVAHLAGLIAAQMGGDAILARRAGLMHDIGKALTHEAPGSHVDLGADICKRYGECETVINAIYAHHGHEEPINVESAAVCAADALSAARPGARREVLESFLKRVEEIENITTSKIGVTNAYAINAGREVRVIVNAKLVNDDEAVLLATEIAKEIEEKVQYPGEIKINVIRELRAESYAR